ncbi:uncharacterized protein LOC18443764 isoform X1 [Amborella trichopoda]|nr:uncharacterized protein LOC18443764 isoform X1 [Amborella trichopoda]|eukprot:XP_006854008.2 uncharacterized protein LOC18443764 isoform X1 [Amborella trichopoda]
MVSLLMNEEAKPNSNLLSAKTYRKVLNDAIERFSQALHEEHCDFSELRSLFGRLIQARIDPPLEVIWCFSATIFFEETSEETNVLSHVSSTRKIFEHIALCTASCTGPKSIAAMAPVVFELYQAINGFITVASHSGWKKRDKKLGNEIEKLIDDIAAHISICNSNGDAICSVLADGEEKNSSLSCFDDLIKIWMMGFSQKYGKVRDKGNFNDFYPLIGEYTRDVLFEEGCSIERLSGLVTSEVFLLMLSWKLVSPHQPSRTFHEAPGVEVNELKAWAVGAITGFRNNSFFVILMRLLLEPALPVTSLLGSVNEDLLREVLYDAVLLVDYSFMKSVTEDKQSNAHLESLALLRVVVAHQAVQVYSMKGNQMKAIAHIEAFSRSCVPSILVNCVSSQTSKEKLRNSRDATPQVFLKCLLKLDDEGLRKFQEKIRELGIKFVDEDFTQVLFHKVSKHNFDKSDDLFYIEKKGQKEEVGDDPFYIDKKGKVDIDDHGDDMDNAFSIAARSMKFTPNDQKRKRKEEKKRGGKSQVKFLKHKLDNDLKHKTSPPLGDGRHSDVDNEEESSE